MIYDILVREEYLDKAGNTKSVHRKIGTAFDPRNGGAGCNGEPFQNVAITGPFIIRPRKERGAADAQEVDGGDDFCE